MGAGGVASSFIPLSVHWKAGGKVKQRSFTQGTRVWANGRSGQSVSTTQAAGQSVQPLNEPYVPSALRSTMTGVSSMEPEPLQSTGPLVGPNASSNAPF